MKYCLNCNRNLSEQDKFCSTCGQSVKASRVSFWSLFKDLFATIFNIDGRIASSIKYIFKPWLQARAYIEGQRLRFVSPIRLFFTLLIGLFGLLFFLEKDSININLDDQLDEYEQAYIVLDSIDTFIKTTKDTSMIAGLEAFKASKYQQYINDSLDVFADDVTFFGTDVGHYGVSTKDAAIMDIEDIIEKYNIEKTLDQLLIKQIIKFSKNSSTGGIFLLRNLTWVFLLSTFLSALLLKVIFILKNYYYVEHLVLILYGQSTLLFLCLMYLLTEQFIDIPYEGLLVIPLIGLVMQALSFRYFYKSKWLWTILLLIIFNLGLLMLFFLVMIFTMILFFFIF